MNDIIESVGRSVIQHGPNSGRVYLMKLHSGDDLPALHILMEQRVGENGYGKIFAKIPASAQASFLERGYLEEARIPGYYRGREDAVLMAYYNDPDRAIDRQAVKTAEVLRVARSRSPSVLPPLTPLTARRLTLGDIRQLTGLYRATFESYPFPITDPSYIAATMESHVKYFGVFDSERLVAAASAEMHSDALAVEMTDFATFPDCRGQGLARGLLSIMDTAMRQQGLLTAYTIARALSYGINIAFAEGGYRFGGTLINNTGISGAIESMNVWHRDLLLRKSKDIKN